MNTNTLIFTVAGMLIDTIMLFFFLNCYSIKENRKTLAMVLYIFYFLINFVLGCTDIDLWIRTIVNICLIIIIGLIVYDNINYYEIGKEAIIYILLVGIAEFLLIPVVFLYTNDFSADIFKDPTKPYLWLLSMGFSRMIAMFLFKGYRKINKQSYKSLDKQEWLILYLPLLITLICFLIILRIVLDIENFEKEQFSILLGGFACALLFYTLIHMIFYEKYIRYRNINQELLMLKQKDELKYEYYKNQIQSFEDMRILYHDLKNHMLLSNYDNLYLEKTKEALQQFEQNLNTGCDILNILLWEKSKEAEKYGINFECIIENVDLSFMEDMDICSIIGNILDNAIEACQELLNVKRPAVSIKIGNVNNFIIFKTQNDCIGSSKIKLKSNVFKTTKEMKKLHGIGLSSVKYAVEKYDGHCEFDTYNDVFIVEILIPYPIRQ